MVTTLNFNSTGRSTHAGNAVRVVVTGRLAEDDINVIEDKLRASYGEHGQGTQLQLNLSLRPKPIFGVPASAQPRSVKVFIWDFLNSADVDLIIKKLDDKFLKE